MNRLKSLKNLPEHAAIGVLCLGMVIVLVCQANPIPASHPTSPGNRKPAGASSAHKPATHSSGFKLQFKSPEQGPVWRTWTGAPIRVMESELLAFREVDKNGIRVHGLYRKVGDAAPIPPETPVIFGLARISRNATDFKLQTLVNNGREYHLKFLVTPWKGLRPEETPSLEIYAGVDSQCATNSSLRIEVEDHNHIPGHVHLTATYADSSRAGTWTIEGKQIDWLVLDGDKEVEFNAGSRPGKVFIVATWQDPKTGQRVSTPPHVITVSRPVCQIDYGNWQRDGQRWKRQVTIRPWASAYQRLTGWSIHAKVVNPEAPAPNISGLEHGSGVTGQDGTFKTTQYWQLGPGADLELDWYKVMATCQPPQSGARPK